MLHREDFPEWTEGLEAQARREVVRDPKMLQRSFEQLGTPFGLQVFLMFSFVHHIEALHLRLSSIRLLRRIVNDYIIQIVFQGHDMRWKEQKEASEEVIPKIQKGIVVDIPELVKRINRLLSDMMKLSLDEWKALFPEATRINPATERADYFENALRLLYRLPFWAEEAYENLKVLLLDEDPRLGAKVIPLMLRLASGRETEVLGLMEAAREQYLKSEGPFLATDYSRRLQLVNLAIKELAPFGAETLMEERDPNETVADLAPDE